MPQVNQPENFGIELSIPEYSVFFIEVMSTNTFQPQKHEILTYNKFSNQLTQQGEHIWCKNGCFDP